MREIFLGCSDMQMTISQLFNGVHRISKLNLYLLRIKPKLNRLLVSSQLNHIVCPSLAVVSLIPVPLTSASPKMTQEHLVSSFDNSLTSYTHTESGHSKIE